MRYGFGILSLLGALSRDAAADVAPTWQYVVHIEARQPGIAEIELRIQDASARAAKRVCLMMEGAGRYLDTPRSVERGVEHALLPDKHDEDCWTAPRALRVVRYRARLAEMADALGDWDWASRVGDDYVLRDGAILVHPDPPPPDDNAARFLVRFELPAGASEATPWRRLDGEAHAYALDSRQYREGSYLAIGKLRSLGDVTMSDGLPGVAAMTILDHPHRTTDEDLVRWCSERRRWWRAFMASFQEDRRRGPTSS